MIPGALYQQVAYYDGFHYQLHFCISQDRETVMFSLWYISDDGESGTDILHNPVDLYDGIYALVGVLE